MCMRKKNNIYSLYFYIVLPMLKTQKKLLNSQIDSIF